MRLLPHDPVLRDLRRHLDQLGREDARDEYIEKRTQEITNELIDGPPRDFDQAVNCGVGFRVEDLDSMSALQQRIAQAGKSKDDAAMLDAAKQLAALILERMEIEAKDRAEREADEREDEYPDPEDHYAH